MGNWTPILVFLQRVDLSRHSCLFQDYLNDIAQDPVKSKLCKQRVMCRTLAGNLVYTLTITSPYKQASEVKVLSSLQLISKPDRAVKQRKTDG